MLVIDFVDESVTGWVGFSKI